MKINVDYDNEDDILYFYSKEEKVDFSIDNDDIILDISSNKVVGIEIIDASEKFASEELDIERVKQVLSSIREAHMSIKYGTNTVIVKLGFISSMPEETKEGILIQVPIERQMVVSA